MARVIKAGYNAKAVAAFVKEQIEPGEATRANSRPVEFIGRQRVSADDQRRIQDWATTRETAELAAVDRLLMRYGLALWEFEHWATELYGDSTYFDTIVAVPA